MFGDLGPAKQGSGNPPKICFRPRQVMAFLKVANTAKSMMTRLLQSFDLLKVPQPTGGDLWGGMWSEWLERTTPNTVIGKIRSFETQDTRVLCNPQAVCVPTTCTFVLYFWCSGFDRCGANGCGHRKRTRSSPKD